MTKNLWIFIVVPLLLIAAIGLAIFFSQPQVAKDQNVSYVDVDGDEYLSQDYITEEQEGIGNESDPTPADYFIPVKVTDCLERPQGELRDTCYLLYTSITEKPEGCESIQDATIKDDCFTRAAFLSKQPSMCERVERGYSLCYSDIATEINDASLCEKTDYEKKQCHVAFAAKDATLCAQSSDMSSCVFAVLDQNEAKCDEIQSYKSFCYNSVALATNNFSLCTKVEGVAKDSCIFRIALNTNNVALCENLTDTRDSCVAWIAYNTQNIQLCANAGSEAQSCREDLS